MVGIWAFLAWNVVLAGALAIAVGIAGCLKVVRHRPGLRHTLWLLVLVKLVTPPLIPLPVLPARSDESSTAQRDRRSNPTEREPFEHPLDARESGSSLGDADGGSYALRERPALPASSADVATDRSEGVLWSSLVLLVGFSACGTAVVITSGIRRTVQVSRLLLRSPMAGVERLELASRRAAARMGLKHSPQICVVDARVAPMLWAGWHRPVVIVPKTLADRLTDEQISCILCHELAHYVRRDHWANAFVFLVTAVFWWHPVVWWAQRELRAAQELCCDALVIGGAAASRRSYAETLYVALEFVQAERPLMPQSASCFGQSSLVQRRFEMIASVKLSYRLPYWAYAPILAVAAALPCVPVRGQSRDRDAGGVERGVNQPDAETAKRVARPLGEKASSTSSGAPKAYTGPQLASRAAARTLAVVSGKVEYRRTSGNKGMPWSKWTVHHLETKSHTSYRLQRPGSSNTRINHHAMHMIYVETPQPNGEVHSSLSVGWPVSIEKQVDVRPYGHGVFGAGAIWPLKTRQYVEKHATEARLVGTEVVDRVQTRVVELRVPKEDVGPAFRTLYRAMRKEGGIIRLYVAPQMGFVVPKMQFVAPDGTVLCRFEASGFQQKSPGLWFPKKASRVGVSEKNAHYIVFEIIKAESLNEPIDPKVFAITIPAGTRIEDGRVEPNSRMPHRVVRETTLKAPGDFDRLLKASVPFGRFVKRPASESSDKSLEKGKTP